MFEKLVLVLIFLLTLAITVAISTGCCMLGWYLFAVPYLKLEMISFTQALGLGLLSSAIFGRAHVNSK